MPARDEADSAAVIEQAKGVLMALNYTDAEAAWAALQRVARESDLDLRALAEATIAIATTPEPDVDTRAARAVYELLTRSLPRALGEPGRYLQDPKRESR